MADPAAAYTRKALPKSESSEEGRNCSYNKTQDSCGVLFGEVKLGEADYTVIWEKLLFMSNILCQIPWKCLLMPTAFSRLFAIGKCEKHSPRIFCADMIKPGTYVN